MDNDAPVSKTESVPAERTKDSSASNRQEHLISDSETPKTNASTSIFVAGGPMIQSRSTVAESRHASKRSNAALFSFENGEFMFLTLVVTNGIEDACATFRHANWEIPRLSSRLRALATELQLMEITLWQNLDTSHEKDHNPAFGSGLV